MLEIKGLKKAFGSLEVLKGVDLKVNQGDVVAILGPSGSGKTTMLRCVNFLEHADGGSLIFDGKEYPFHNISKKDIAAIRQKTAFVFQNYNLFLNKTALHNVTEGLIIGRKMPKTRAEEKARAALEKVGMLDRADYYPHQLSGGMRQRVVIAIALACNPDLLICDEPTTALDVTIQAKIIELIRRVQKERGISVIYITHDLGVVAKVADYVNVMYAGKIVEKGMINEIFYDPKHPYTWGLLSAMPDLDTADERLYTIPGSPPNLLNEKPGDAFAPRNKYALNIDSRLEPPMFKISETHSAATWLLHPKAPKVDMPPELRDRIERMKKEGGIA